MRILFLTTGRIDNINEFGIYADLLRCLKQKGHDIYAVSSNERRKQQKTSLSVESGIYNLRVKTGNITKCGVLEKGVSTILIEGQFKRAIQKYFWNVSFDLVLYSTPPITFANVIKYVKKRDGAKTYLMLKDIFPQNAVDLGMMKTTGVKGLIYKYFRRKEKKLYELSDRIGCMSQANVNYVLQENPEIAPSKVEVCPNCIEVRDLSLNDVQGKEMRDKYGIPNDKKVFVYGGNLGKPQGIPFLIDCLKTQLENPDVFFLIVGDGTEFGKLEEFFNKEQPRNMKLMKRLPKEDYDRMIAACDVGLIFLDHRFTIPNFPSRLLSYMQAGLPVLACTDPNTDIGKVITDGGFGWWCESNDVEGFVNTINEIDFEQAKVAGRKSFEYLKRYYTIESAYRVVMKEV